MDINAIAEFAKQHLVEYWSLLVVALLLGMVSQVFKNRVWTKARAERSRVCHWLRATLPLHAPLIGALIGLGMVLIVGAENTPRPPVVEGAGAIVLSYCGAGVVSAWVFGALKRVMKMRGIKGPLMEETK